MIAAKQRSGRVVSIEKKPNRERYVWNQPMIYISVTSHFNIYLKETTMTIQPIPNSTVSLIISII